MTCFVKYELKGVNYVVEIWTHVPRAPHRRDRFPNNESSQM